MCVFCRPKKRLRREVDNHKQVKPKRFAKENPKSNRSKSVEIGFKSKQKWQRNGDQSDRKSRNKNQRNSQQAKTGKFKSKSFNNSKGNGKTLKRKYEGGKPDGNKAAKKKRKETDSKDEGKTTYIYSWILSLLKIHKLW